MQAMLARHLLMALCLLGLAACQPYVHTDVTVFHEWPAGVAGKSYAFAPEPVQQGSLEYKAYAEQIRQQLFGWGFTEKPASQAELLLVFTATVDDGRTVTDSTPEFVQRCTPVYNRKRDRYDSVCSQEYAGNSVSSRVFYRHRLSLEMRDRQQQTRGEKHNVYEGKVSAESGCPQLNSVMPYLVQGLFRQFPGASGRSVTVDVPVRQREGGSLFNPRSECDSLAP